MNRELDNNPRFNWNDIGMTIKIDAGTIAVLIFIVLFFIKLS